LITSLPSTPSPNSTFQSIWGASESDIIPAYEAFVYEKPGPSATPEEIAAWHDEIQPFTSLIFGNVDLLLPWQSSATGYQSMVGQLYQFSDPLLIGGISAQYQSSFTAIPEPSSLVLSVLAASALLPLSLRRRRRAD